MNSRELRLGVWYWYLLFFSLDSHANRARVLRGRRFSGTITQYEVQPAQASHLPEPKHTTQTQSMNFLLLERCGQQLTCLARI
jgi:hypothetical protein